MPNNFYNTFDIDYAKIFLGFIFFTFFMSTNNSGNYLLFPMVNVLIRSGRTVARDIIGHSTYNTRVKSTAIEPNESWGSALQRASTHIRGARVHALRPHLYPIFIGHGEVFKGLLNVVSKRVKEKRCRRERLWLLRFSIHFFFLNTRDGQQALRRSGAH